MADEATKISGVWLRKLRDPDTQETKTFVLCDLEQAFPAVGAPTVDNLANRFHLGADDTWKHLMLSWLNAATITVLYNDIVKGPGTSLASMSAQVRAKGSETTWTKVGSVTKTEERYHSFTLAPSAIHKVLVPLSAGFKDVLAKAAMMAGSQSRVDIVKPTFDALAQSLDEIEKQTAQLASKLDAYKRNSRIGASHLAILDAMDAMMGVLAGFPKGKPSADEVKNLTTLRMRVRNVRNFCHEPMVVKPPGFETPEARGETLANALLAKIESADFFKQFKDTSNNDDIVDAVKPGLWSRSFEVLQNAYVTLLDSAASNAVLERHVKKAIETLAANQKTVLADKIVVPNLPDFEREAKTPGTPQSASSNVFVFVAGYAQITTTLVGNIPGPSSLLTIVFAKAAPKLVELIIKSSGATKAGLAARQSGLLYRAVITLARFNGAEQAALADAVNLKSLAKVRSLPWGNKVMTNPEVGAVIALVNIVVILAVVEGSDDLTLSAWFTIFSSGLQATLGVAETFARFQQLVQKGIVPASAKILGAVAGLLAVVSGIMSAADASAVHDMVGVALGAAAAAGGFISVLGFVFACAAEAAAAASPAAALGPWGEGMMLAGALIGLAVGAITLIIEATKVGSRQVWEACWAQFTKAGTPYDGLEDKISGLKSARADVDDHGVWDFWDASNLLVPQLLDLGLGKQLVAKIVNETESFVVSHADGRSVDVT